METIPFLRDIDDEKHYAELLEIAFVEAYTELRQVLTDAKLITKWRPGGQPESIDLRVQFEPLSRMMYVMDHTIQQSVERRRRLANITRGLADVVLDKEGSEE